MKDNQEWCCARHYGKCFYMNFLLTTNFRGIGSIIPILEMSELKPLEVKEFA